jgi:hypothetical protein
MQKVWSDQIVDVTLRAASFTQPNLQNCLERFPISLMHRRKKLQFDLFNDLPLGMKQEINGMVLN